MVLLDPYKQTDLKPLAGRMLIAEPFLADPNFARSVVFICEHGEDGTVGFALNRPTELTLGDLLPDMYTPSLDVFHGGPVQVDTLHMLHRMPSQLGGMEVAEGVYWGGSFEALQMAVASNSYDAHDMRMFVGYAGWTAEQLQKEIEEHAWIIADANPALLFETDSNTLWKKAIQSLGKEFSYLANLPLNPQLN